MEEHLELLLVCLVLVVDWQRHLNVCVVELNVLWLQVGSTKWAEHASHLEAEEATLHSWLFLKGGIELHAWDPFGVTSRGTD